MSAALAVFLKAPRAGSVKTRLAAEIGERQALRLYRVMATRTLAAASETDLEITVWFAPADALAEMRSWLGERWTLRSQSSGDLGARLAAAAQAVEPGRGWLAIGADCPGLDAPLLRVAATIVAQDEVALGPTRDGGYYLFGGRTPLPPLFDRDRVEHEPGARGHPRAARARGGPMARVAHPARRGHRRGRAGRRTLDLIRGRGPYWPTCVPRPWSPWMAWRVVEHDDRRWTVSIVAERRANSPQWNLVFSFRPADPGHRPIWATYPLSSPPRPRCSPRRNRYPTTPSPPSSRSSCSDPVHAAPFVIA